MKFWERSKGLREPNITRIPMDFLKRTRGAIPPDHSIRFHSSTVPSHRSTPASGVLLVHDISGKAKGLREPNITCRRLDFLKRTRGAIPPDHSIRFHLDTFSLLRCFVTSWILAKVTRKIPTTRMHSSRMHTACWRVVPVGDMFRPVPRGGVDLVHGHPPTPPRSWSDTCLWKHNLRSLHWSTFTNLKCW